MFRSRRNAILMSLSVAVLAAFLTTHFKLEEGLQALIDFGSLALVVAALAISFQRHRAWADFALGLIAAALSAAIYAATLFVVSALEGHPQNGQWALFWLEVVWEEATLVCVIGYAVLWLAIKAASCVRESQPRGER